MWTTVCAGASGIERARRSMNITAKAVTASKALRRVERLTRNSAPASRASAFSIRSQLSPL